MAITDPVPVPTGINPGVTNAKQVTMLAILGSPRDSFSDECQPVTSPRLRPLMITASVGPFSVTGLRPAVQSLRDVLSDVASEAAVVAAALGTAGMLCARFVRGSTHSISNHSWGTAVDLTLNGVLDRRGDGRVQQGLLDIAPIFNRHRWFWGAGFGTEDAMHFEASDELIRDWSARGLLGAGPTPPPRILTLGDRGPEVVALQTSLNGQGAGLEPDGIFGPSTRAAVVAFQATHDLVPDGVVGPETSRALGLA